MDSPADLFATWLPRIGAGYHSLLFGLIGLLKPRIFLDPLNIQLGGPAAFSEARAVFGGLNLGLSIAALTLDEPHIFTALGIGWAAVTLARFWSIAVDGMGFKASIPMVVLDGALCLLFLSPLLLR
ncbi:MAG: hypothetical protein U5K56_21565 [Halioglobus sp.]|nr:hypothetical protein [Halioglobus sp.]